MKRKTRQKIDDIYRKYYMIKAGNDSPLLKKQINAAIAQIPAKLQYTRK